MNSRICGVGHYLPERCLTNEDMQQFVDTSDEWIQTRTGMTKRYFAAEHQKVSELATYAAQAALRDANISSEEVDLIVLATSTPDETFPATATQVQAKLGNTSALAFDVAGVCSGFLLALQQADNALRLGQARTALVIGAEIYSRILDMTDRRTCVLFGDGAGAVVLRAEPDSIEGAGIIDISLQTDGRLHDILYTSGGVATTQTAGKIKMEGPEVFRHAVEKMVSAGRAMMQKHALIPEHIDWLVPHQANIRILQAVAQRLAMPQEKVATTVTEHANTSAASIPLALSTMKERGALQPGQLVLLVAMGGGAIWGSGLLRW